MVESTTAPVSPGDALQHRLQREQQTLERICEVMIAELERFGFTDLMSAINEPMVNPELRKDSFDGSESLFIEWRTPTGALLGYVLIHGGGQIYAEFDVLKPHPKKPQWVIEAITVWGTEAEIKADPRLLPALTE